MTHLPRLTIGLPVYNGEDYLAHSLDSVLDQSYTDFVLLISSNRSTDSTDDICAEYARRDPRIRFVRQQKNLGAAGNHNYCFSQCRTELFKWASADDLWDPSLVERCIDLLDSTPTAALAHSWTAVIDGEDNLIQAFEYPRNTSSFDPAERLRSILFDEDDLPGAMCADDFYGVVRSEVLRRVKPHGSYFHADQVFTAEMALNGRFVQVPEWLHFRRHHAGRALVANPTVRSWCSNLDPRRSNGIVHPTVRLLAEFPLDYAAAVMRSPLTASEKRRCLVHLSRWVCDRAGRRIPLGQSRRASTLPPLDPKVASRVVVPTGRSALR